MSSGSVGSQHKHKRKVKLHRRKKMLKKTRYLRRKLGR